MQEQRGRMASHEPTKKTFVIKCAMKHENRDLPQTLIFILIAHSTPLKKIFPKP